MITSVWPAVHCLPAWVVKVFAPVPMATDVVDVPRIAAAAVAADVALAAAAVALLDAAVACVEAVVALVAAFVALVEAPEADVAAFEACVVAVVALVAAAVALDEAAVAAVLAVLALAVADVADVDAPVADVAAPVALDAAAVALAAAAVVLLWTLDCSASSPAVTSPSSPQIVAKTRTASVFESVPPDASTDPLMVCQVPLSVFAAVTWNSRKSPGVAPRMKILAFGEP